MIRPGGRVWTGLLVILLLPQAARSAADPGYENLALNRPATADASQNDTLTPGKGNDGDTETRWCPPDGDTGHWWQVDLGKPETLTGARVFWEFDGRGYQYKIEGSADGKTWRLLSDQTGSQSRDQDQRLTFHADGVRHVRLTVTGLTEGWGSFYEFAVFGTRPAPASQAAAPAPANPAARLLKGIKVPPGWKLSLFAAPPDVRYPTCLAAAPTGEVFVGVDENGSIDAKPKRGRVVRCVDKDGDGTADEIKVFAEMDSPRGLVFDASTGTLYVQHPPYITAHHDDNGDGVADRAEVLVKGIGFDLSRRGADHTTNGMRLGIDGFLYVAVGDYGFVKAVGKDGATAQLHGGGIARVRTDGSGLEVYARGQRNIYDVAIDPHLNIFTRDNTNDGGGWDVRLSHVIPTAQMGYPSLFTNFNDEIVQPLADYGGGSPCGSLYLQEPGFPAGFGDILYTCDWGRGVVYRHPLTPHGAGFKADQIPFIEMPRPTDMDVDGTGRIYLSSWKDGGFTFSGPNVGYVIRVTPPGYEPKAFPDLKKASKEELVKHVGSPSAVMRLAAQREILRRGSDPAFVQELATLATSGKQPLAARVAALLTLSQFLAKRLHLAVALTAKQPDLMEYAIRAEADRNPDLSEPALANWLKYAISDPNPRVRLQAVVACGRLGHMKAAPALVKATADPDPLVAHAAINALVTLRPIDACLAALDPKTPELAPGAARALQGIHDARTVDGLIEKLGAAKDDTLRRPILRALCRLYAREADWDGSWWTTRPDTSGPYYKPVAWDQTEKIGQALRSALGSSDEPSARWLLAEMMRNKVEIEGTTQLVLKIASTDPVFRAATVGVLANRPKIPAEALGLLGLVASSDKEPPALRGRALRGLIRSLDRPEAREAAVAALAAVGRLQTPPGDLAGAWQDFVKDARQARDLGYYVKIAEGPDPARAELAYAVILNAEANPKAPSVTKQVARDAVARALATPALTARLLHAVGRTRSQSYAVQVRDRLRSDNPAVHAAALEAARRLGLARPAGSGGKSVPVISAMPYEQVIASVRQEKGDPALGSQLFERVGCINCHTVAKSEGPKGPYLGDIANRYSRLELAESVLKPSAKIAQGFETQRFATENGQTYEGFVVRESGDEVEIRNAAGAVTVLPKKEIDERGKSEISVMPTGLADPLTPRELASILAYLEGLNKGGK